MALSNLIRFSRRCNVRGLTFLPQQFAGVLPHGVYRHKGNELVSYRDLGVTSQAIMTRLERVGHDEVWYVAPAAAVAAIEATRKQDAADRAYLDSCLDR